MCSQNVNNSPDSLLNENSIKFDVSLSNNSRLKSVFLQTLQVYLKTGGQPRKVRGLLDSGSQSSYIREEIVRHTKVYPIRQEVIHGLFGGKETKPILHTVYTVEVSDLDNNFICKFEALSEKKICGFVPKI
ncbi:DUF1758 domain-containing protein [Trichonephila clavipes]|nr:DUF1758 domain-containing protein [Trichonephila clavipes]